MDSPIDSNPDWTEISADTFLKIHVFNHQHFRIRKYRSVRTLYGEDLDIRIFVIGAAFHCPVEVLKETVDVETRETRYFLNGLVTTWSWYKHLRIEAEFLECLARDRQRKSSAA